MTWRTIGQAARELDCTERTVWARIAAGKLQTTLQDGRRLVNVDRRGTEGTEANLQSIFQSTPQYRRDVAAILRELAGLLEGDSDAK